MCPSADPQIRFFTCGRGTGKSAAMAKLLRDDDRYVTVCASTTQRDALRRQFPDIDPARFVSAEEGER